MVINFHFWCTTTSLPNWNFPDNFLFSSMTNTQTNEKQSNNKQTNSQIHSSKVESKKKYVYLLFLRFQGPILPGLVLTWFMTCRNSSHFFPNHQKNAGVDVIRPLICLEMRCQNSILEGEDSQERRGLVSRLLSMPFIVAKKTLPCG